MEITGFRFEQLSGTLDVSPSELHEQRFARPLDVYEEFRGDPDPPWWPDGYGDRETTPVEQVFLHVETDEEVSGVVGPISERRARSIDRFERYLLGRDPLATEKLWDLLYRKAVHGRKGTTMMGISALDVALWDLKGRYLDEPVYRLLGGPTRERLPAYASTLGCAVAPDAVRERAADLKDRGYEAQKWFFRHGVGSGREGKRKNVELVAAARDAVGPGYDLMFDAWMSWDRSYAQDVIDDVAEYDPRWIEEPLQPDRIDAYADLRDAVDVPVAAGEHEYTRWGAHDLLARGAVDVLQMDTLWAGGLTEMRHVCSLASVHDVPVVPHGMSVPANLHLSAAMPPTRCPLVEYLINNNRQFQFFYADRFEPEDGDLAVPDRPGVGVAIDDSRVESRTPLSFD